jgi:hypothetical protein
MLGSVPGMYPNLQLVVDCTDPHPLADWWAEALGWVVEAQDATFIRSMVDQGQATEADTTTYRGALVWKEAVAIRPSRDEQRNGPRILFQQVPELKTVKNRLHLDVRVPADRTREGEVARLVASGATELYQASQGPFTWTTLADPEGNEFCVTG